MRRESNKRRDTPRLEQTTTITAHFEGGRHVCLLKHVSPRGAGLMFNPDLYLPASFDLELGQGESVPVVVAWRRRDQMGVRFVKRGSRLDLGRALAWVGRRLERKAA